MLVAWVIVDAMQDTVDKLVRSVRKFSVSADGRRDEWPAGHNQFTTYMLACLAVHVEFFSFDGIEQRVSTLNEIQHTVEPAGVSKIFQSFDRYLIRS